MLKTTVMDTAVDRLSFSLPPVTSAPTLSYRAGPHPGCECRESAKWGGLAHMRTRGYHLHSCTHLRACVSATECAQDGGVRSKELASSQVPLRVVYFPCFLAPLSHSAKLKNKWRKPSGRQRNESAKDKTDEGRGGKIVGQNKLEQPKKDKTRRE